MGRFIQQQIKTLVSRFIPTAWCPSCGKPLKVEKTQSDGQIRSKVTKSTTKKKKK